MSYAMSYALPARVTPVADNRTTAGATDVFSFQPLSRASVAVTTGANIAGGGGGMTSRRGSTVPQARGSFSSSDNRFGGDNSNPLGYTLRGAGALTSRTRSPPGSPLMSPVGAAAAASPATSAASHASNPMSASWNAASAAASSVRASIALDVGHAPRVALSISSMALHPAHVALTFQRGTVFCVFDAVSGPGGVGADLSEADEDRLRAFIRRGKAVDPTGKPEGAFNSPATPLLALRTVDSVIVGLHFIPPLSSGGKDAASAAAAVSTPLRLLVVQQNATYLVWEYGPATTGANGSAWQYVARGNLPSPLPAARAADAREVMQVAFHAQQQTLVWLEKQSIRSGAVHALYATQLPVLLNQRLPDVIDGSRLIRTHFTFPALPSAAAAHSSSPATILHCADRGVFVTPPPSDTAAQSLYYFSLQSQLLVRIALPSDSTRAVFAVHAQTRSLFGLDDRRRLLSFVERGAVDTADPTLNLFDPALYVRSKVECVLEADAKPAPPTAARSRLSSSASMRPTEAEVAPPFLPTGSHFVVFGDYLALLRPSVASPNAGSAPQLRCSFYTVLGGLHLSSFMLAEPAPPTSYIGEDDEDEPDSPVHSSAPPVASGAVLRGVACATAGFGGSGVAMHSRRTVWWLRISPVAQQVSAMLRKRAGTNATQQPVVDAPLSQSARQLQKLIQASQSLVPAAIGLLPPSLNSSPAFTSQRARAPSSGSSFSTLSALDSPMLSSSTHGGSSGGSHSALLADSMPPSVQSHIAESVLTPFGESAMPLRCKQQVQGLMSNLLSQNSASSSAPHRAEPSFVPLRLGESNHVSLKNAVDEHEEMKEGGGEGQQHLQHPLSPHSQHAAFPDLETPDPLSAPSLHKSFPQLFRILQSPALAISLMHLPTTMPSSFSMQPDGSSSALLSPAFSAITFDAQLERTLRDEIARYLKIMQPLKTKHNSRRSKHPNSRTTSGNNSVARRSSALVMNGYGHDDDSGNSDSSSDSSSDDSSPSNSPRASPTASPSRRRDTLQMPNGSPRKSMNGSSSSVRAQSNGRNHRSQAARTALYNCFQLYTPLAVQTLPLIEQYAAVMRAIRRIRHGGGSALGARQLSGQGEEGKQGGSGGLDFASPSSPSPYASHPATYIPPLPSLQQQLSKAITNRLTKLATGAATSPFNATPSADRSFTSLVIHDASATLAYLTQLLGLQGLQQLVAQRAAGTASVSSNDLHRVLPSLLLVNEETKLRRELLQSASRGVGHDIASASQSFVSMSRLDSLPYFETLVRLFDQLAPQLLPDFVQLMDEMFSAQRSRRKDSSQQPQRFTAPAHKSVLLTALEMEAHVERALRILPPILSPQRDPSLVQLLPLSGAAGGNRSSRQASGETGGEEDDSSAGFETDGRRTVEAVGEEKSDDSAVAARNQAAYLAAAQQQSQAEHLRLARISARCSLLLQSGRPIEAVLLRLRMADEERDSSQEEEAIALAGCIVRDHELEAREMSRERGASGASAAGGSQNALRAELFHHLFTHWLQRQFRLQYAAAQQLCSSAFADAAAAVAADVSYLSSPLPSLDPRISALMPPHYTAAIYLELVEHQRRKFTQEMEHAKLEGMVHRQPPPPSTPTKAKQAATTAASEAEATAVGPEMFPLLLPSLTNASGAPAVDLPMSCLLNELKYFAERL